MADPLRSYLLGTGLAFVLSFVLALVGNDWVQELAWFGGHRTGEFGARIDWQAMWGFMFTVTFLPLTFCFGGAFSLAVFKYPTIESKGGKVVLLSGVAGVFVYLATAAWDSRLGLAKDILSCGVFGCFAAKRNDLNQAGDFDTNYRVAVGTCLFFPAVCASAFTALLIARVGADPPASAAISGLIDVNGICGRGGRQQQRQQQQQAGGGGARGGRVSSLEVGASSDSVGGGGGMLDEVLEASKANSALREGLLPLGGGGDDNDDGRRLLPGAPRMRARDGRIKGYHHPASVKKAVFIHSLGLLALLALLLVATSWVPQNWEQLTKNGLIAYASVKPKDFTPEKEGSPLTTQHVTLQSHDPATLVLHVFPDCVVFYAFLAFLVVVGSASKLHDGLGKWLKQRVLLCDDQPPPKWWWSWVAAPPVSVSKGGLVVVAAFGASLGFWLAYWDRMHSWHNGEKIEQSAHCARVLGQLANFLMGVMLIPVTKNSVLTSCFGIAWEQVIFVHVWLGQTVLLVVAMHMLCWWATFDQQASFPEDILQVPMWYPANSGCAPGDLKCFQDFKESRQPDSDNFTVQMATLTSLLMWVCMGFFARYSVRRGNYELFYYMHHAFLVVFGTALLHAASSWYFLSGGLVLWYFDRCVRALTRSRRWALLSLTPYPEAGVTRIELAPLDDPFGRAGGGGAFRFSCGQYVYLNIPCLGAHEWHPFTISSSPTDRGAVTVHVKAMPPSQGPGSGLESTFTGRLLLLAKAAEAKKKSGVVSLQNDASSGGGAFVDAVLRGPDGRASDAAAQGPPLVVSVDGPYGESLDVEAHEELLLLAGGVGFTPVHSILRAVRARMLTGQKCCRRVHVMLAVQTRAALDPFLHTLQDVAADDFDGRCVLSVFVDNEPTPSSSKGGAPLFKLNKTRTNDNAAASVGAVGNGNGNGDGDKTAYFEYKGVPFQVGRLNPVPFIKELAAKEGGGGHVFVCGPPGLAATADLACLQSGVSFHKEVFAF